jgi:hypothetical protein
MAVMYGGRGAVTVRALLLPGRWMIRDLRAWTHPGIAGKSDAAFKFLEVLSMCSKKDWTLDDKGPVCI